MFTIDYSFYTDTYGGTLIQESDFGRLSDRAIGITNGYVLIDLYENYEIPEQLDVVLHKAVCAVAELISTYMKNGSAVINPLVSQESVAGVWSKSYATAKQTTAASEFYYAVITVLNDYLGGTRLLFKGGFVIG